MNEAAELLTFERVLVWLSLFAGIVGIIALGTLAIRGVLSFRNTELSARLAAVEAELEVIQEYQEKNVKKWQQRAARAQEKEKEAGETVAQMQLRLMGNQTANGRQEVPGPADLYKRAKRGGLI